MDNGYILEVAWGIPTQDYPQNGIFQFDQAKAISNHIQVIYLALDLRSVRKWRKWGLNLYKKNKIPVYEYNVPYGPLWVSVKYYIQKYMFKRAVKKIIRDYGTPKCVHVHNVQQALAVSDYCLESDIPYLITEHSTPCYESKSIECKKMYTYKNANAVITVSKRAAEDIKKSYGVIPYVIPNIVESDVFVYNPQKHNGVVFVSAGNIVKGKGFDILIDALSRIVSAGYECKLIIMGDGPERQNIEDVAKNQGVFDCIEFKGEYTRKEFAQQLQLCDCFVLASKSETFGIVYIEALASGVPVIATKCGGPEDFVDETNGILVDVDDVNQLAKAMIGVIECDKKFNHKNISEDSKKRFSAETFANAFCSIFNGM